jgi:2-(1,2-epoxy-1,2-dihydrophenyl)acetyl-CoA isomerase
VIGDLELLRLEIDGDIGTLILDRPEDHNGFSQEMVEELAATTAWLADRAPLRAVVLTGAGRSFCAGGDVSLFRDAWATDRDGMTARLRRLTGVLNEAILSLQRVPYPVIAAINGPAVGAGLGLALACDLRIASERASLMFGYGRLGACPDAGTSFFLPRIVGPGRALELLLEDGRLRAPRALAEGLVTQVVPPDELMTVALSRATRLARASPHYVRATKQLLARSLTNGLADHLQLERHALADGSETDDFGRGLEALFAGRRPHFNGT